MDNLYTFDQSTAQTLLEVARLFRENGGRFEGIRARQSPGGAAGGAQAPVVNEVRVALPTTSGTIGGTGAQTVTPGSMTDIYVGTVLLIDAGAPQETVTVTAVTATTFSATFSTSHSGAVAIVAQENSYGFPCRVRTWDGTDWSDDYAPAQVIDPNDAALTNGYCDLARVVRKEIDGSLTYVIAAVNPDIEDDKGNELSNPAVIRIDNATLTTGAGDIGTFAPDPCSATANGIVICQPGTPQQLGTGPKIIDGVGSTGSLLVIANTGASTDATAINAAGNIDLVSVNGNTIISNVAGLALNFEAVGGGGIDAFMIAGAFFNPQTIASSSHAGGTVTVDTVDVHGYLVNDIVVVGGATVQILTVPTTSSFTYAGSTSPTGTVQFAAPWLQIICGQSGYAPGVYVSNGSTNYRGHTGNASGTRTFVGGICVG